MAVFRSGRDQSATLDEVKEIEDHIHGRSRSFGISANQSGTDWALEDGLTPYSVDSGDGAWGVVAKVFGTSDTPIDAGNTMVDPGDILIETLQHTSNYVFRLIWGTGTSADAITAGQYTSTRFIKTTATGSGRGAPFRVKMDRIAVGTKVWAQVKNATNNSTVTFFVDAHEYLR